MILAGPFDLKWELTHSALRGYQTSDIRHQPEPVSVAPALGSLAHGTLYYFNSGTISCFRCSWSRSRGKEVKQVPTPPKAGPFPLFFTIIALGLPLCYSSLFGLGLRAGGGIVVYDRRTRDFALPVGWGLWAVVVV
jgi:hypothetical protein